MKVTYKWVIETHCRWLLDNMMLSLDMGEDLH